MNASTSNAPPDSPRLDRRLKVLFVAEAVTLAHVARPLVLAQGLPASQYDATLATDPRYEKLYAGSPVKRTSLHSISSQRFTQALAKGHRLYDLATLRRYVEDDLKLIQAHRPDVIVGDMRLSLAASARLARVPYITLTNAYWSPLAEVEHPIPDGPITHVLGVKASQALFNLIRPSVFAFHARPMNHILREHGLPSLQGSLARAYTDADLTLYADLPGLTPMKPLPSHHQYLGAILWEPDLPLPDWWDALPADKPVVYVNLGSSGPGRLLKPVINALARLDVTAIVATAGNVTLAHLPDNIRVASYLPGLQACQRADLVICNGGSPSTQQAIAAGKPMLCIPSNMDQLLNTQGIVQTGLGRQIRSDQLNAAKVAQEARNLLSGSDYAHTAAHWQVKLRAMDIHARFRDALQQLAG